MTEQNLLDALEYERFVSPLLTLGENERSEQEFNLSMERADEIFAKLEKADL